MIKYLWVKKMEHKIKKIYTKEDVVDFKKFTLTKNSVLKPWLLYIMCIAVVIFAFIYNRKFELNFTTVVYPCIAILSGIIITFIYYVNPKENLDSFSETELEYVFDNDGITMGDDFVAYADIFCVYENKDTYYIFVTETTGFPLDKEEVDFDLIALFKEKEVKTKTPKIKKTK